MPAEKRQLVGTGTLFNSVVVVGDAILLGYALGGPAKRIREVLVTTTAARNVAIALLIATTSFREPGVLTIIVVFGLAPWNSWRHEFYKPMETVQDADRGGFIFAPEVGSTRTFMNSTSSRCTRTAPVLETSLAACFGYQGFSNVNFGRIECHEAINVFAREILLTAKPRLEAGDWGVVHGIVDSIWMTPDPDVDDDDREDLEMFATEITGSIEIRLEHKAHYGWVAFVSQRKSEASALTNSFGKVAGGDDFKIRGIEARQRSTPPYIEAVQQKCLERFDTTLSPAHYSTL